MKTARHGSTRWARFAGQRKEHGDDRRTDGVCGGRRPGSADVDAVAAGIGGLGGRDVFLRCSIICYLNNRAGPHYLMLLKYPLN